MSGHRLVVDDGEAGLVLTVLPGVGYTAQGSVLARPAAALRSRGRSVRTVVWDGRPGFDDARRVYGDVLRDGVALLGGDARCRYVYSEPGAHGDVLAAWTSLLGDRAWVVPRERAVADGWFGPLGDGMADRIGDVLAVPHGDLAIVASEREPWLNGMVGMHGSLVPAEQLVPLLATSRP